MDKNSSLRLFLYSPVEQAIDFAARAVPFVKPQPKLTDEAPLMTPAVPAGLPEATEETGRPMLIVSAALLVGAIVVLALGTGKLSQARNWRGETGLGKAFANHQPPASQSGGR